MLRIKGRVGDWPVDLTVEMDAEDWAQLAAHLPLEAPPGAVRSAPAASPADAHWQQAPALLQRACEIACLEDLIARLPEGLETAVGEHGYALSGGERQRCALARARGA